LSKSKIGHNLGYAHSGEDGNPYGDTTGMMGYLSGADTPKCFNGAKSWQTGWYTTKTRVVEAGDFFEGDLYGIAHYGNAASSVVLVKINNSSATDIHVTYNHKSGINSGTKHGGNQVTVSRQGVRVPATRNQNCWQSWSLAGHGAV
jgi:hypothetical protein